MLNAPRESADCHIRVPETLPKEVLDRMHAPPKPDYPIASADTLRNYDGFLFRIPTRYGNFPGQWKVRLPDGAPEYISLSVVRRPSGTPRASFGLKAPCLGSSAAHLSLPLPKEAVKR